MNKWIDVKERLPDSNRQTEVVFYANPYEWRCGVFTPKGFAKSDENVFQRHDLDGDDRYYTVENVVAWMELPAPTIK